jgi:hypothetical protein
VVRRENDTAERHDIGHNPPAAKLNHEDPLSLKNLAIAKIFRKIPLDPELSLLNSRQTGLTISGEVHPIQTTATQTTPIPMKLLLTVLCSTFMILPTAFASDCEKGSCEKGGCDKNKKEEVKLVGCDKCKKDDQKKEEQKLANCGDCKKKCGDDKCDEKEKAKLASCGDCKKKCDDDKCDDKKEKAKLA